MNCEAFSLGFLGLAVILTPETIPIILSGR
jgi:hypothetical protein